MRETDSSRTYDRETKGTIAQEAIAARQDTNAQETNPEGTTIAEMRTSGRTTIWKSSPANE